MLLSPMLFSGKVQVESASWVATTMAVSVETLGSSCATLQDGVSFLNMEAEEQKLQQMLQDRLYIPNVFSTHQASKWILICSVVWTFLIVHVGARMWTTNLRTWRWIMGTKKFPLPSDTQHNPFPSSRREANHLGSDESSFRRARDCASNILRAIWLVWGWQISSLWYTTCKQDLSIDQSFNFWTSAIIRHLQRRLLLLLPRRYVVFGQHMEHIVSYKPKPISLNWVYIRLTVQPHFKNISWNRQVKLSLCMYPAGHSRGGCSSCPAASCYPS